MTDLHLPDDAADVPAYEEPVDRPRLSLTSDVLDFRKCRRKYGMYTVRGFEGSSPTAEFVGTFAHRAMEEAWRHYRDHGRAPDHDEVVTMLERVRTRLLDEGRRPHSWPAVFHAGYQVLRMTKTMADLALFAQVVDSERTFRSGEDGYVLEGVVDMILDVDGDLLLWDFKSATDPRRTLLDPDASERSERAARGTLADYTLQLRLYHFLCETVLEEPPGGCELVFLGELGNADLDFDAYSDLEAAWLDVDATPLSRGQWDEYKTQARGRSEHGLFYAVDNSPETVADAVADFESTAREIIECRESDTWPAPDVEALPSRQTCEDCDFLHSCRPAMSQRSSE